MFPLKVKIKHIIQLAFIFPKIKFKVIHFFFLNLGDIPSTIKNKNHLLFFYYHEIATLNL